MASLYSIEGTLAEPSGADGSSKWTSQHALREIGLTFTPFGVRTRVLVRTDGWPKWEVDVPASRAMEYAKQLWKYPNVNQVIVLGQEVPKPISENIVADIQKEFADFKARVVKLAMEKAKEHDWCGVVRETLEELGLEVPKNRLRIVLEVDITDDDDDVDPDDLDSVKHHVRWGMGSLDIENSIVSAEPITPEV